MLLRGVYNNIIHYNIKMHEHDFQFGMRASRDEEDEKNRYKENIFYAL